MAKNSILVITASPRAGSNSAGAASIILSRVAGSGFRVSRVNINSLKIHPCTACGKCAAGFKCVYRDDAPALIKKIKLASIVIVASPVYFTGVPAPLKAFIDRNQPEWERRTQKSKVKGKKYGKGIIILTAGTAKAKYFRPAGSEIRSLFAVNGIKTAAVIKLGNMDRAGSVTDNKKVLKLLSKKLKSGIELLSPSPSGRRPG
ncbi:MAG: flavodoxin family protein [Spirochaetia bacterium]|nr:flavodoxin family protein [Spirochaetia bacterium]